MLMANRMDDMIAAIRSWPDSQQIITEFAPMQFWSLLATNDYLTLWYAQEVQGVRRDIEW